MRESWENVFWELTYVIVMKVSRNENIKRNVYENKSKTK